MLMQASRREPPAAYVVVLGNEKGGAGKSTVAMHMAVALLNSGQKVATVDLDLRQRTLTHYIENRRAWAKPFRREPCRPLPFLRDTRLRSKRARQRGHRIQGFVDALSAVEHSHHFILIDTAGSDNHLTRLAHSMANTLVSPLNDSFVDFDVLGTVDPETYSVTGESHYARMVREARQQRRLADGVRMDWVVVRNRLSTLGSRNRERIVKGLNELAVRLGFRGADGLAERVIYREFFPRGLTALDDLDERTLGARPSLSHVTARHELLGLIETLRLPIDERARQRAVAQAQWLACRHKPLELDTVIAE